MAETSAEREKQRAVTLEEQAKENQAELITLDTKLAAAYEQVEILENQKKRIVEELAEAQAGEEQAHSAIAKLTAEVVKRREDALVSIDSSLLYCVTFVVRYYCLLPALLGFFLCTFLKLM